MAITLRGSTSGNSAAATATTVALNLPSGRTAGDFAVLQIVTVNGVTVTGPAGWTERANVDTGNTRLAIFTRTLVAADVSATSVSATLGSANAWAGGVALYYSNTAGSSVVFDAIGALASVTTNATARSYGAVTPVAANALRLGFLSHRTNATATTASMSTPTGWTEVWDQSDTRTGVQRRTASFGHIQLSGQAGTAQATAATTASSTGTGGTYGMTLAEAVPVNARPLAQITDDFATQDGTKWTGFSADASVSGGLLRMQSTTSYPSISLAELGKLSESALTLQNVFAPDATGTPSLAVYIQLEINGTTDSHLRWNFDGTNHWYPVRAVAGVDTVIGSGGISAVAGMWLRIRATGGVVFWESSTDGLSWVTAGSWTATFDISAVRLTIFAGHWQSTDATPAPLTFDNLNLPPSASGGQQDATAQPAAVAATAGIAGPSAGAGATPTPAAVAATAAVPAPAAGVSSTASPTAVAAVAGVPAATASASRVAAPVAVAAVAAVPTPVASTSRTAAPAAVAATAGVPTPGAGAGSVAAPAPVAAVAGVPAATAGAGAVAQPAAVRAVAMVPGPGVTSSATATPLPVEAVAGVPSAAVQAGSSTVAAPASVAASAGIPGPGVTFGQTATVVSVRAAAGVPSAAAGASSTAKPGTVAAVAGVATASASAGGGVLVDPVVARAGVPAPATEGTSIPSPAGVRAVAGVPVAVALVSAAITAVAVEARAGVPAPGRASGVVASPGPVAAAAAVPTPWVNPVVNVLAVAAWAGVATPDVTAAVGATAAPAAVAARAGVATPRREGAGGLFELFDALGTAYLYDGETLVELTPST